MSARLSEQRTTDWADGYEVPAGVMRIEAYVWWCGDDDCDCTQFVIEAIRPNPRVGLPWIERDRLLTGEFRTDGEWAGSNRELNREAARLRRHHNALFHRIEWPWDRDQ